MIAYLTKTLQDYRVRPRWHPRRPPKKHRAEILLHILTTAALLLMASAQAEDVCGSSQDWFHGWLDSAAVTYQAMDVSISNEPLVVVGGSTSNAAAFYNSSLATLVETDTSAAIVIAYSLNSKDPEGVAVISMVKFGGEETKFTGVRQVAISPDNAVAIVLFETDKDDDTDGRITISSFSLDSDSQTLTFNQAYNALGKGVFLSTNNFLTFAGSDYHPVVAGVGPKSNNKAIYILRYDKYSLQFSAKHKIQDITGAHTMKKVSASPNYINMVSFGSYCSTSSTTALWNSQLSIVSQNLTCAWCIEDVATTMVSEVSEVLSYENGDSVVFLEATDNSGEFFSIAWEGCDSPTIRKMSNLPASTTLQLVRPTGVGSLKVIITLKSSAGYHIVLNFDPFGETATHTLYNAEFSTNVLDAAYSKHMTANHLVVGVLANDSNPYLTVMSETDLFKFRIALDQDEEKQCMAANIKTSTFAIETSTISNSEVSGIELELDQKNYVTSTEERLSSFSEESEWKVESPSTLYNENACAVSVTGLFAQTSHNLLGLTSTEMEIDEESLSQGSCPSSNLAFSGTRRYFVSLTTEDSTNLPIDIAFFENASDAKTESDVLRVAPLVTTHEPGTYTLEYQVGYASQTEQQVQNNPTQTVTINLEKDCQFIKPEITPSLMLDDDARTFVFDDDPLVLQFTKNTQVCEFTSTILYADGTIFDAEWSMFSTGYESTEDDTLTISTNDPANVGVYNLAYEMTSTKDSSFFDRTEFTVTILLSTCSSEWRYPLRTPFDFQDVTYVVYDEPVPVQVFFDSIDISNCRFELALTDIVDESLANLDFVTLVQPILEQEDQISARDTSSADVDERLISVTKYGSMIVESNDLAHVGTYSLQLRINAKRYAEDTESQVVDITLHVVPCDREEGNDLGYICGDAEEDETAVIILPTFAEDLTQKSLVTDERQEWQLPEIVQGSSPVAQVNVVVNTETLESLITYAPESNSLIFDGSESSLGLSETFSSITIALVDENGRISEYVQYLHLIAPLPQTAEDESLQTTDTVAGGNEGKSETSAGTGKGGSQTSSQTSIFEFDYWSRSQDGTQVTSSNSTQTADVLVTNMTSTGQISLTFDPPRVLVRDFWNSLPRGDDYADLSDEEKAKTDEIMAELVIFAFIQHSDEPAQDRFQAKITNFTRSGIEIQANFSQPLLVSQNVRQLDQIKVILRRDFFTIFDNIPAVNSPPVTDTSKEQYSGGLRNLSFQKNPPMRQRYLDQEDYDGSGFDDEAYFTLLIDAPRQVMSLKEKVQLQSASESLKTAFRIQLVVSIALSLLLKGVLGQMWSMFNTLQLLVSLSAMAVIMPGNVLEAQALVLNIINAKIVPTELLEEIFSWEIDDDDQTDSIQKEILFATLAILLALLLISLLLLCRTICCCRFAKKIYAFMKAKLIFNSLLRACLQTFLATVSSVMFSLKVMDIASSAGKVDFAITIISLIYCFGLTIFALRFLQKRFEKLPDTAFRNRFGSLYLNVNTYDKKAVYFTFLFLLRRVLFAATLTFCDFSIVLQVFLADVQSTVLLAFYLSVRPMQGVINNFTEVLNETAVLASIQALFLFTDYVGDPVLRYRFGYNFLYFIAGVTAINIVVFIFGIITIIALKVKNWYTRRQRKARIVAIRERQKEQKIATSISDLTDPTGNNNLEVDIFEQSDSIVGRLPHRKQIITRSQLGDLESDDRGQSSEEIEYGSRDKIRPLDSEGDIIYSLRSDGPPLAKPQQLHDQTNHDEDGDGPTKVELADVSAPSGRLDGHDEQQPSKGQLDGESLFSGSSASSPRIRDLQLELFDMTTPPSSEIAENENENDKDSRQEDSEEVQSNKPLSKLDFIKKYKFDPTLYQKGLLRFEFYEKYGFDPLEPPVATEGDKSPPIIIQDKIVNFYYHV